MKEVYAKHLYITHNRQVITRHEPGLGGRWWPHRGAYRWTDEGQTQIWRYLYIPFPIPIRLKRRFINVETFEAVKFRKDLTLWETKLSEVHKVSKPWWLPFRTGYRYAGITEGVQYNFWRLKKIPQGRRDLRHGVPVGESRYVRRHKRQFA